MAQKNTINWYKVIIFAGIVVAVFLLGRSCGVKSVIKTTGVDTIITKTTIDTQYVPGPARIFYKDSLVYVPSEGKTVFDTLYETEVRIDPADTAAILRDYNATRFYSDTQSLKRGWVVIQDSVTRNRIASRRLQSFFTDTTIKETVTLIQPKRTIFYIGTSISGRRAKLFEGIGWDLSMKTGNDMMYSAGIRFIDDPGYRTARTMYEVGIRFPIRLKSLH